MPEVDIKDKNNNIIGKLNLREDIFSAHVKQGTIHDAVVNFLANQRQGTHATKTKGLISGGGKKTLEAETYWKSKVRQHPFSFMERRRNSFWSSAERLFI